MKSILLSILILFTQNTFAQESETNTSQILIVETDDVIVQGNVDLNSNPELFVGETYFFTILANMKDWDLKIETENLTIKLNEESKKGTGGLNFEVTPIDTGFCEFVLYIVNDKPKQVCLQSSRYHASKHLMPPVFIGSIRSGDVINEIKEATELSCKYGGGSGVFEEYPILSWTADLEGEKFSGKGTKLSKQLIEAINESSENKVLKLTVELSENKTGYNKSEAVYLIK